MAEMIPQIGGAPEAIAIPKDRGTETSDTIKPATRSCFQCFRPFIPFSGLSAEEEALGVTLVTVSSMIMIPMQHEGSHQLAMALHYGISFRRSKPLPGLVHG